MYITEVEISLYFKQNIRLKYKAKVDKDYYELLERVVWDGVKNISPGLYTIWA